MKHGRKKPVYFCETSFPQVVISRYSRHPFGILSVSFYQNISMDELSDEEAWDTGLAHWLSCDSRCFGDKGDVEDITEGWYTPE